MVFHPATKFLFLFIKDPRQMKMESRERPSPRKRRGGCLESCKTIKQENGPAQAQRQRKACPGRLLEKGCDKKAGRKEIGLRLIQSDSDTVREIRIELQNSRQFSVPQVLVFTFILRYPFSFIISIDFVWFLR